MVNRYGAFVLLKPPVEPATYVLWYRPAGCWCVVGLVGTLVWLRRRRAAPADAAPLSAEESRRLDGLMRGERRLILPFLLALLAFVAAAADRGAAAARQPAGRRRAASFDQAVYRDQLQELDRDIARGLITAAEAEAARLEIQRRLLAADQSCRRRRRGCRAARCWRLVVFVVIAAGSVGSYLWLGAPGLPDEPFSARQRRTSRGSDEPAGVCSRRRTRWRRS